MNSTGNHLEDFPPETFMVLAFCGACDHQAPLDRTRVPASASVSEVCRRLRRSTCGSRQTDLRILYTGAGGFHYRREETNGPTGS